MTKSISMRRVRGADHVDEPPVKRKRGRPTDYEPWMLDHAARLAYAGHTIPEIGEELGVTERTIYLWMNERPDFFQAVKNAKAGPDERVKQSLFQQALAGNTTAQIFWLKNRRPHEFRDRQEHELVVPVDTHVSGEDTDVRHLALAALALITEAGNTQVLDQVPVSYDKEENADDGGYEDEADADAEGQGEARVDI